MLLMIEIQYNIIFVIVIATRFAKNLSHIYTKVIKTILYYLKRLIYCGIIYYRQK